MGNFMPRARVVSAPTPRILRVYAFDPSRGERLENCLTIQIPYEPLGKGPVGRKIAVIDYDATNRCYYEGVDLDAVGTFVDGIEDPTRMVRDHLGQELRPFPRLEIRAQDPDYQAIVNEGQPVVFLPDLDHLHELAEAPVDRLALTLDSICNNTSLVILFRYRGKSLLFPGDAQWGSWQSWIGAEYSRQLIGAVDFLKVAHHGSENATPVDLVHALKAAGLAAMVPTQIRALPHHPPHAFAR